MFSNRFVAATRKLSTYDKPVPAPLMRRSFYIMDEVVSASLTITGLGFYELYINGQNITRCPLSPYISNPDHYVYYDEYDITGMLVRGENVIGIVLGNGMQDCFGGHVWDFEKAAWRSSPKTAFSLEVQTSGGAVHIEADNSVKVHDSAIYMNDLRAGVFYDARRETAGWCLPGFDDTQWDNAIPVEAPRGEPVLGMHEPVVIEREVKPVSISWGRVSHPPVPRSDVRPQKVDCPRDEMNWEGYIYDFGENNAGVCRLRVKGERGQKIILQFAEFIAQDGGLDLRNMQFMPAQYNQRDIYILRGDPEGEEFTPPFTYHGFRYCLVMGLKPEQAVPETLTYLIMHGDFRGLSSFECSDELANRLFTATLRSNVSNFYYFPTDCPHREKNGWTGDASVSSEQFMLNHSMENSLREWLRNIRAAQLEDGQIPGIIPTGGWGYAWGNGPAWDSVLINLPYFIWKYRGNTDVIKENSIAIMRYLDSLYSRRNSKNLLKIGLGDWCQAEQQGEPLAPLELVATLITIDTCEKARAMFTAVGETERADYVSVLGRKLKASARSELIDGETLTALGNCQTSQAMAIYYGMFSEEELPKAVEVLVKLIHDNGDRLRVGILGSRVMFEVLSENGYSDLAWSVAMTKRFPSFGYWMDNGMTTLPESFRKFDQPLDSLNHHFFGSITGWMLKDIVGINVNPDNSSPAYVEIAPCFVSQLNYAKGSFETVAGKVEVCWKRVSASEILLTINSADGISGRIKLPCGWTFESGA